jgi:hypothetical protein
VILRILKYLIGTIVGGVVGSVALFASADHFLSKENPHWSTNVGSWIVFEGALTLGIPLGVATVSSLILWLQHKYHQSYLVTAIVGGIVFVATLFACGVMGLLICLVPLVWAAILSLFGIIGLKGHCRAVRQTKHEYL